MKNDILIDVIERLKLVNTNLNQLHKFIPAVASHPVMDASITVLEETIEILDTCDNDS